MSVFRAKVIKQIDANKVATDFTKWCNNKSDCLYKSKKRKFHGWLNLTNLSKKNKVAQCGWDDGDCNHTTHYGIGGYHNVCPIGGFNGDLPWPAKLRFSDFDFKSNGITSTSKVKSITVHFEHRMIAIDTGTGTKYDNFGPTFHAKNGWGCKVYFTNGNAVVSKVQQYKGNPKLSKKDYSSINYKFDDITISELLKKNFALNIEYNHNHNTNPGIIYLKNVYIDVEYDSASIYLEGSANTNQLYLSKQEPCRTVLYHTIKAGYKNGDKIINPSAAPEKLGNKIQCLKKPSNVTVTKIKDSDSEKQFKIVDTSQKTGKKTIKYNLSNYPNKTVSLSYQAIQRPKPTYSFVPVYKSNEDFDSSKSYVIFKSGCASQIKIYIDSLDTTPLVLNVANQNSTTNLLDTTAIKAYHDRVKGLPCGPHVLYIQRGDETIQEARNNKVVITIRPMQFLFHIYDETTNTLSLQQSKTNRYQNIIIERIDNEPQKYIPQINVTDETNPTITTSYNDVAKGDIINYQIDKYYAGEYYISIQDTNQCNSSYRDKIIINSYHKQNYDYLFTRGEDGTAFDFDYLVAWEGDNIKEPL
ncbi:MAG: hypothetical protein IJ672_07415, partial [Methanobrevibacter sp.]|nr:hypothetical protein [Methanobrevibacter sp.]